MLVVILILGLLLVGSVSAIGFLKYSEPTYSNSDIIDWKESVLDKRVDCIKEEWNNNFEEYRNDLILKEDMINYTNILLTASDNFIKAVDKKLLSF